MIYTKFCVSFAVHTRPHTLRFPVQHQAYAKINLGLRVLERRPDGYHNIETVFHRVGLSDDLTFEASDRIEVVSSDPAAPGGPTNLCFRAAAMLQELTGSPKGVRINLVKRIPVGAGLGGGSSDAALVLRELPRFWEKALDQPRILASALRLGSDIPYFLGDGSALAWGRGEILEYFTLDLPYAILLCTPDIHVSTAWAYRQVVPRPADDRPGLKAMLTEGVLRGDILREQLTNDFEPAVFSAYPAIASIKKRLLELGAAVALMSGSGSTVYGLFLDPSAASRAGDTFRAQGCRVSLTPPHFHPGDPR